MSNLDCIQFIECLNNDYDKVALDWPIDKLCDLIFR